ncbi:MAG: protease modulator HflC [Chloroflexi bacterium]|nr:protease modulator HflC [Chloroflexota bacterium]
MTGMLFRIGLVLVLLGGYLSTQIFYIVDERDQVIVTQVGQFLYSVREPGVYTKMPFYQNVTRFERRILINDANPAEYLTLDKKRLVADHITRWRIIEPLAFYTSVRDETGAKARLDDLVSAEMRAELANHDFDKVISTQREQIMEKVSRRVADRVKQSGFGIEVVDVRLKRADLPQEVQASVFARMQAERSRIASRYRSEGAESAAKIRAEADKERTIILAKAYEESQRVRGEGDAGATTVYATAYGQDSEFYAFLRSLQAYEKFIDTESTMILSTDSDLFRYLNSHQNNGGRVQPGR